MTKPKVSGQCPICLKVLQHTSKHIREVHRIKNASERSILNAISTGRVDIGKGTCPVPGCGLFRRRLSNHIEGHSDLLPGRREAYQQVAHRDAALKRLSELRATNPQPPMASVLDLEDSLASECRNPSCIQREFRIRELESTDKEPAVALDPEEPAVAQDEGEEESGQSGASEPNHQLSSGDHDTIDPDIVPSEPAVPLDPEEPAVVLNPEVPAVALDPEEPAVALDPEEPAVALDPEEPAVALDPEEPAVALDPEEPAVAQDEDVKESEESGVSEPNLQESSGDDDDEFPLTAGEAAEEEETRLAVADNVREIAAADRDTMLGKSRGAGVLVHQALQKIFQGRCKGSTGDFKFPKAIADYMEQYGEHIFRPQGTRKVQENCISRTVRAKSFVAYMMFGSPKPHWDWGFMSNIEHLRAYPAVLRALKKKPNTAQTYFMQVRAFVEYFNNKVPKGCRLTGDQRTEVFWELQKVAKDTGRSIAAHQLAVKGQKQERLLSREALVRCTRLARERIPSLLDAVEAAPPKDRSTRFLFLGYLSAYLACIYGHRTGVFTKMTQAEVKRAVGDDQSGYLINVLEHKTVQTYGHAQVYLTAEEYGWCRRWLGLLRRTVPSNVYFFCSFGAGPIKDLRGYMGRAWTDMGLGPVPTFMDIRSAVATYNYESNQDPKTRESVAQFMCHSERVQEKFYALHKTVKRARKMREFFVALSMMEQDDGPGTSQDAPSPQKPVKRRKDSLTVKAAKKIRHLLSPQKRNLDKKQRQLRVRLPRLPMDTK